MIVLKTHPYVFVKRAIEGNQRISPKYFPKGLLANVGQGDHALWFKRQCEARIVWPCESLQLCNDFFNINRNVVGMSASE
jgi:hypothetical protein